VTAVRQHDVPRHRWYVLTQTPASVVLLRHTAVSWHSFCRGTRIAEINVPLCDEPHRNGAATALNCAIATILVDMRLIRATSASADFSRATALSNSACFCSRSDPTRRLWSKSRPASRSSFANSASALRARPDAWPRCVAHALLQAARPDREFSDRGEHLSCIGRYANIVGPLSDDPLTRATVCSMPGGRLARRTNRCAVQTATNLDYIIRTRAVAASQSADTPHL